MHCNDNEARMYLSASYIISEDTLICYVFLLFLSDIGMILCSARLALRPATVTPSALVADNPRYRDIGIHFISIILSPPLT
jgi:hypothetical protein